MRDPFKPEREMLTAEEAAKIRAELDANWEALDAKLAEADTVEKRLALTDDMNRVMIDDLFAPWEVSCPLVAYLIRKQAA
jgi:hypothetical protein